MCVWEKMYIILYEPAGVSLKHHHIPLIDFYCFLEITCVFIANGNILNFA